MASFFKVPLRAAVAVLATFCAAGTTEASVLLLQYDFNNVNGVANYVAPGVTAGDFTPGVLGGGANGDVAGFDDGGYFFGETFSQSFSTAPFASFLVNASGLGMALDLEKLDFLARYEGNNAQGSIKVTLEGNGFSSSQLVNFQSLTDWRLFSIDLSSVPLISGDTFNIYLFDHAASSTQAHVLIDDVSLYGEVVAFDTTPAPEPASLALMGLGGVGMGFGAWRRKRQAKRAALSA